MPPVPPPLTNPTLARPAQGAPGAWFSTADYPAAALRRSAEGRTIARLAVGADGRITGCTVATSSGDADLDRATCAVAMRGRRLSPARAADGATIASTYALHVRWVLPSDDAAPASAPSPARAPASAGPPPSTSRRHGWFERLLAAHHFIGLFTALLAFLGSRVRRRGRGPAYAQGDRWLDGDQAPARGWRRRFQGRWARLATGVGPVFLLALVFAWLDW